MNPSVWQDTSAGNDKLRFYQSHLDRVSRSFALGIRQLESPVREWIGLAYLLFRLLDTIEDSAWASRQDQKDAFRTFGKLVEEPYDAERAREWSENFLLKASALPEGERLLIHDASALLSDLHGLSANDEHVHSILVSGLQSMSSGMQHFALREPEGGRLKLRNSLETDQYCFFVAGVVGELLTRLVLEPLSTSQAGEVLPQAFHFGLFLQKVNLLKDQRQDALEGRFLVADRDRLRASVNHHAWQALDYLTALPPSLRSYRIFCAWALYLGLASLPWIDQAWNEHSVPKMPRARALLLMERIKRKIDDDTALKAEAKKYLGERPLTVAANEDEPNSSLIEPWFRKAYRGQLTSEDLMGLGVVAHAT